VISDGKVWFATRTDATHASGDKSSPDMDCEAATLIASSGRIQRELGWQPKYPDLRAIAESAWKWHQAHPNGCGD